MMPPQRDFLGNLCSTPWEMGCWGCRGHSPQDAQAAARLLQPPAEQAHAGVTQCAVTQLQLGQAGVTGQQLRQLRAAAPGQPAPVQPGGDTETPSVHHTLSHWP